jgi:Asp-tRNA(Asn)/Glu-tRNA(Gln) amidotransferase A subunit family amidase
VEGKMMMFLKKNSISDSLSSVHNYTSLSGQEIYERHFDARFNEVEKQIQAFVHDKDESELEELLLTKIDNSRELALNIENALPLLGIPVAVKDLFHVDGFATHGGSKLPAEVLTGNEGWVIKRLQQLGAWMMGKTVTEEFAYASIIPTKNPHDLAHTSGGSSAGSAAAVASGMSPLAIGTQTLRSVMAPASFCGVVGFKVSYGRVPLDGCLLMSPSFDTFGMFTQDLESLKYAAAWLVPEWQTVEKTRKPVLGIPKGVFMELLEKGVYEIFMDKVEQLTQAGFTVKQVEMPWSNDLLLGYDMLNLARGELALGHRDWFASYEASYGEAVHQAIVAGKDIDEQQLKQYRKDQLELRQQLQASADAEGIDLWISPAQAGPAPLIGGPTGWAGMTSIWTYAGCPTLSLPLMEMNQLPLGFQCIAPYGRDEQLLAYSSSIEQILKGDE